MLHVLDDELLGRPKYKLLLVMRKCIRDADKSGALGRIYDIAKNLIKAISQRTYACNKQPWDTETWPWLYYNQTILKHSPAFSQYFPGLIEINKTGNVKMPINNSILILVSNLSDENYFPLSESSKHLNVNCKTNEIWNKMSTKCLRKAIFRKLLIKVQTYTIIQSTIMCSVYALKHKNYCLARQAFGIDYNARK